MKIKLNSKQSIYLCFAVVIFFILATVFYPLVTSSLIEKNQQTLADNNTVLFLTLIIIFILLITVWFIYRNAQEHINELKLLYRQVRKSEIQERRIRDMMIDSVIIIDHQGIIKEFNKAAEKILGYTEKEAIGKNVNFLMTSGDINQHDQYINNYLKTKQSKIIGIGREVIVKRKNNTTFFADLSISKFSKNGSPFFIGTIHDVTARKDYELQLLQIQNDLEYRVKQRTEELAVANILLSQHANFDALTGLANRYLFFDRLTQASAQAKRNNYNLVILFIDLDGFKNINDSYGHETGDEVLKKISNRMLKCLRDEDTVSRIGGDEFAIILNEVNDISVIGKVVERIINEVNQPLGISDKNIPVGASVGISIYPKDSTDPDELLKQADMAMYKSKNKGKNTFTFFAEQPLILKTNHKS